MADLDYDPRCEGVPDEPGGGGEPPRERASPAPPARCPDRGGSGRIVLLTSSRCCGRCRGTGKVAVGNVETEAVAERLSGTESYSYGLTDDERNGLGGAALIDPIIRISYPPK